MRIEKSSLILEDNGKSIIVKEFAKNYPEINALNEVSAVVQVMNDIFALSQQAEEYLYLIAMNTKGKPISFFEVSHGTHNAALVGCREIMIRALLCGASSIIIVHNHPSGQPEASREDLAITKRVEDAAELIGIAFCDHVIIGKEGYYSFREKGHIITGGKNLTPSGYKLHQI